MAAEKSRKKSKEKNQDTGFLENVRTYIKEVRSEMSKVSWPSRDDVVRLTRIVLIVTILSSLILGGVSFLLTVGMNYSINNAPWVLVIAFIGIVAGAWYLLFGSNRQKSNY